MRHSDGSFKRNRLGEERSPYLRQHADNPVDWYPWGEEAFADARSANRPIFLSVGYSTCHWCHVMNRESFSDPAVAEFMNEHFINIKVDREERPDIDRVYMSFVQATTGSGGWPMSVWLTPELHPIAGGTYFPPTDAFGRPSFLSVLKRLSEAWGEQEEQLRSTAIGVTEQLREVTAVGRSSSGDDGFSAGLLDTMRLQMAAEFDPKEGGFGPAPKFPRPSQLLFLFHEAKRLGDHSDDGWQALEMATLTLERMERGGIHDHLGGGYHRYSVDARWHIPHYEKMLYDQSQLVEAFLIAFQSTGREEFAAAARDILDYVGRDMTSPEGGFYSAEDADSLVEGTDQEAEAAGHESEGAFYIWRKDEIDRLLGESSELFCSVYGVKEEGNAAQDSDPHGELSGTNTLYRRLTDVEAAEASNLSVEEVAERLAEGRRILREARDKRSRPHLDDKVITAWNGLMISAFAKAHTVLGDAKYLERAERAARFLRDELYDAKEGTLLRVWRGEASNVPGFAEDHAFLIRGLLDLYEAAFDVDMLAWAVELQKRQDALFGDEGHGGYFSTTGEDASVLLRVKEDYDGAEPSPNTVAVSNLLRLSYLLSVPDYYRKAEETLRVLLPQMQISPRAVPLGLVAMQDLLYPGEQVVLVGDRSDPALQEMLRIIRSQFRPGVTTALIDGDSARNFFAEHAEFYASLSQSDGRATAHVCSAFVCDTPTNDIETLRERLDRPRGDATSHAGP